MKPIPFNNWFCILFSLIPLLFVSAVSLASSEEDPREIIRKAMNHWRGVSSYSEVTMVIHRPDWERRMSMRAWTQGDKNSLVRVMEPRKDAGNGTLLKGTNMWTYSPKINQIIKVPSSMMAQSWMGSDFSNKDISKTTDIIDQYEHSLLRTEQQDKHTVYVIESIPHEDAAIVWGKEILFVRDDNVLLEQQFWDQDNQLVKTMKALKLEQMGGRVVASVLRMSQVEDKDEWTEMQTHKVEFDQSLGKGVFTLSNLRNPRQ